jgi:hypothetical protein
LGFEAGEEKKEKRRKEENVIDQKTRGGYGTYINY